MEKTKLNQIVSDLTGDEFCNKLLDHYKKLANKQNVQLTITELKKKITAIDMQITKLADLIVETSKPAVLLRKIEQLEIAKEDFEAKLLIQLEAGQNFKDVRKLG